jgi:16S rRNA (uracil1498-N3)-methyltransferase
VGSPSRPSRDLLRTTSAHVLVAPDELDVGGVIVLDEATEHHLRRVLRLRAGERVSVTDGAGRWRFGSVVVDGSTLRIDPDTDVVVEAPRVEPITIAAAMPKGDRLEWMVQKVTELGVDRLVLLHADRSVVRWKPDRVPDQLARLGRLADEAGRQSRRVRRLVIEGPVDAVEVLATLVVAEPGGRRIEPGDRAVAIGPEGGWSERELAVARDHVTLSETILRTETAAVAAAALCVALEH